MKGEGSRPKKITINDKDYPQLLREVFDPPKEIYVWGNLARQEKYPLAVVGTRQYSNYGETVCSSLVKELAKKGVTIISGLALGIDGIAHQSALKVQGKTIAVLGSGLDIIYPYQHKKLASQIINQGGALVSEYTLGTKPDKWRFPARNRIIAGLAQACLVIEAPEKSGALITATYSIDNGREVLAVPGEIYKKNSIGPNNLIKMGAKPVTEANDILEIFGLEI